MSRWTCVTVPHPLQQDYTSCGVLACKAAELLLQGQSIDFAVDEVSINSMRGEMARTLLDDSDNLTELCRMCGEQDSTDTSEPAVDHWIECTSCSRWFHWVCVECPNPDEDYLCPVCTD